MKHIAVLAFSFTILIAGNSAAQQPFNTRSDPESALNALVNVLTKAGVSGSDLGSVPYEKILFVKTEGWRYGFRLDEQNPLGSFTHIPGTKQVMFRECGSQKSTLLPESSVQTTDQSCGSIPGSSDPSLTAYAPVHWKYLPEKKAFHLKTVAEPGQPFADTVVSCRDLPAALFAVAQDSLNADVTMAGDSNALVQIDASAFHKTEIPLEDRSSLELCKKAPEFWTTNSINKDKIGLGTLNVLEVYNISSY